ncbi:hypothetical protein E2562_036407 [Oryza meyeriana var. granulata]|uniref:Secreted protein n=1 Tax=Oryza meyeriana var. granulata TaxID=110450 RepID=A0A6G1E8D7_9ORYZ|nr:hypothetical protein E2562_036407 [Oryza meyeriana var. granulata]
MCVTPCRATLSKMVAAATLWTNTFVPPCAATHHNMHHPLQWNIGTVHRYTGVSTMPLRSTAARLLRYAPRWL